MPKMLRIEWKPDGAGFNVFNRFYADNWGDVQAVLDECYDCGSRDNIKRIVWPDEEE